jgi:hypothetical protein
VLPLLARPVRRLSWPTLSWLPALSLALACSGNDASPGGNGGNGGSQGGSQSASGGTGAQQAGTNASGAGKPSTSGSGASSGGTSSGSGDGGATEGGEPSQPLGAYWKPQAGATWQWQLSEEVGTPLDVDVYDIDWEADKATVDKLHAAGIKVICYVSVGSWEDFRPDAMDFPAEAIGNEYDGWPGEKYVDIRSAAVRKVMSARFDVCQAKGFDAVEPDNQDVYELGADSGFPLTEKDGIEYGQWLAGAAHSRGLSIGQKNASGITSELVALYDWALTESCYSDGNWCGDVKPYVDADKPVFMCEYAAKSFTAACNAWQPQSFSLILKSLDLDAPVTFCP